MEQIQVTAIENGRVLSEMERSGQYLTFKIAEETYAVDILQVKEILRYEVLTEVPSTPPSIRGVINLRGKVVPVVDLAIKFGLPPSEITKWTCMVIIEIEADGDSNVMGIMVDEVRQVIELGADEIEPPPDFGTRINVDYLVGMGRDDRKFMIILDIDKVLSAQEFIAASRLQEEKAVESSAAPKDGLGGSQTQEKAAAPADDNSGKPEEA